MVAASRRKLAHNVNRTLRGREFIGDTQASPGTTNGGLQKLTASECAVNNVAVGDGLKRPGLLASLMWFLESELLEEQAR